MAIGPHVVHQPPPLQFLNDQGIGVLDEETPPGGDGADEGPFGIHRLQDGQVVLLAHLQVLGAEGGGHVHHPRALLGGHEVAGHDVVGPLVHGQEGVEGLVVRAHQLFALEDPDHLILALQRLLHEGLGQDQLLALLLHDDVGYLRMNSQGHVAGQGPGRGGPDQEGDAGLVPQGELDVDRGIVGLVVAQGHLVV